ncbi:MAG: SRPBCC domain-containing protein, partial [Pseudomonadota bacterium]
MELSHDTVVLNRSFKATPARLFQAYANPKEREIWCVPSADTVFRIEESDVVTGGRETACCGPEDDMKWRMNVTYHRVEQDRLIVFTEELWEHDVLLTIALTTFDFRENGNANPQIIGRTLALGTRTG